MTVAGNACLLCFQRGGSGTVDEHVYVYRCSHCGGCYACEHGIQLDEDGWWWLCRDGQWRPAFYDVGVRVESVKPKVGTNRSHAGMV